MNIPLVGTLILWTIVVGKELFFWVWLWQLKEYHLARFADHFRTCKGRKIILSPFRIIELLLLFGIFGAGEYASFFVIPVFLVFWMKALSVAWRLRKKDFRSPVPTKKTLLILWSGFIMEVGLLVLLWRTGLLTLDLPQSLVILLSVEILAPLLVSLLVLFFQPLVLIWRRRLLKKAGKKRETLKHLKVVGITGSYGKSSTKEFLSTLLSPRFNVLKTKKNQNSEVGAARAVLDRLREEHEFFICEMGGYNRGKIREIAETVDPQIGVLTGINEQHLATFGSQEDIISGKMELLEALPKEGFAVLNQDSDLLVENQEMIEKYGLNSVWCSTKTEADLWAEEVEVGRESVSFKMISKRGEETEIVLNVVGEQNVINFLMACAVAERLGLDFEEIRETAQNIQVPETGMRLKKGRAGVNVVDDTYSANPHGVKAGLEYLTLYPGKRVVVMPCLIELGRESERVHREIGRIIGRVCDRAIITSRDHFEEIKRGGMEAGMKEKEIQFSEETDEILEILEPFLEEGNIILLESRVPQGVVKALIH